MTLIMYILRLISGEDPGFQVRGDGLPAEGGTNIFGVFRVKNHDLPPKNYIFSNFMGASIQKLINIDRSKTGRNFCINLKEVIDRFIWTIELCHIF